jgi:hypothetical protein
MLKCARNCSRAHVRCTTPAWLAGDRERGQSGSNDVLGALLREFNEANFVLGLPVSCHAPPSHELPS